MHTIHPTLPVHHPSLRTNLRTDQALAVDWGGIIRSLNDAVMFERIQREFGLPSEFFTPLLESAMPDYIRGEPDSENEFWKLLSSTAGMYATPSLRGLWRRTFEEDYLPNSQENQKVISLIERVRKAGYPLLLVTNGVKPIQHYFREHPEVSRYNLFDICIESSFVGCKKPDQKFLELPEQLLKEQGLTIPRQNISVIDDIEKYHQAWKRAGYNSVAAPNFESAGDILEAHLRSSEFEF